MILAKLQILTSRESIAERSKVTRMHDGLSAGTVFLTLPTFGVQYHIGGLPRVIGDLLCIFDSLRVVYRFLCVVVLAKVAIHGLLTLR